jgi:hypothetical protein
MRIVKYNENDEYDDAIILYHLFSLVFSLLTIIKYDNDNDNTAIIISWINS